jgi:hypothetical protein
MPGASEGPEGDAWPQAPTIMSSVRAPPPPEVVQVQPAQLRSVLVNEAKQGQK